jgi:Zn-dependent M28 family amino/carboxypeptidase
MHALSCTSFDKRSLLHHIKTLASDEFDGRAPMSSGEEQTLLYLEQEFTRLGLKQLPGWQGFRQAVPLARVNTDILGAVKFGELILEPGKDIVITSESLSEQIDLENVPVVFVGYGITADTYHWNDYANLDVKNKIVVTLVNDPGFASPSHFKGKDMTYYGRWTYKFEEAKRRGALGALVIHETEAAGYGFQVLQHKSSQLIINKPDDPQDLLIQGWLSLDAAKRIFATAQLNFDQIKNKALSPHHTAVQLGTISIKAKNRTTFGQSYNVCGYIEGKEPKDYIALSAHWDHLGSQINTLGHKEIYRGAIDNGTGVSAMLELARHFSQDKPNKNILLCSFTAEEQGLLGAKYFVEHPPMPLNAIKAMLNFDCLNVGAKTKSVVFYGPHDNKLYPLLHQEVARQKRSLIKDPNSEKGYFYRSDHYPFIEKNVNALLFMDIGITNPDYLHHHYHQPSDAHNDNWPLDGMVEDLQLFKNLVMRL